jgi:hypothetical protein
MREPPEVGEQAGLGMTASSHSSEIGDDSDGKRLAPSGGSLDGLICHVHSTGPVKPGLQQIRKLRITTEQQYCGERHGSSQGSSHKSGQFAQQWRPQTRYKSNAKLFNIRSASAGRV